MCEYFYSYECTKNKLSEFAFAFNRILLLSGGISLLQAYKYFFAIVQKTTSTVNFLMLLSNQNFRLKRPTESGTFTMNIIVAVSVAADYSFSGKSYIQYAWLLAATISAFAFHSHLKRKKNCK